MIKYFEFKLLKNPILFCSKNLNYDRIVSMSIGRYATKQYEQIQIFFVTGEQYNIMQQTKKTVVNTNFTSKPGVVIPQTFQSSTNFINSNGNEDRNSLNSLGSYKYGKMTSSKIVSQGGGIEEPNSRITITSNKKIVSGQGLSQYRSTVEWDADKRMVISGETDFAALRHSKQLLLQLLDEFNGKNRVVFQGQYKQDFNKRLLLLQHELEGTMRRVLNLSQMDPNGGKRSMDYTKVLNQKENELTDKDRRIANYEERLRLAQEKTVRLEMQNQHLNGVIGQRNSQIQELRRQLQTKSMAIDKIREKSNVSNVSDIKDILKSLRQEDGNPRNEQVKTYLSQLDRQINKLKNKETSVSELEQSIESWIFGLPNMSELRWKLQQGELRRREDEQYTIMTQKLRVASELYKRQLEQLRNDNPNLYVAFNQQILQTLRMPNTKVSNININGTVSIEKQVRVTKEVPVQDARTKYLVQALAMHVKKLNEKYPKLKGELDPKLSQFLSEEMLEMMNNDDFDRIVDIVRYIPQVVKVENVYAYNSEKSRKVQFHLRVLLKALLEEMQKVKREKGIVLEIDEGVIGMIQSEIMDFVNVDDILKVYRTVPKIVEVPKLIEKVVDNVVRVPQKIELNQMKSQVVPLQKPFMAIDQKAIIVQSQQSVPFYRQKPVEMISHTEKVVSHPQVNERVSIEVREQTHLQPRQVIVEKIVEIQKPIIVQKDKIVIQRELQQVQVIKQVLRYIETEKQIVKPIEIIVQKIVEKVVQRQKLVLVPQIIEKIVQVIRYEKVPQMVPFIETRVQVVREIVEKIVPVTHTEEKIVQIPQIIEKIVTVQKIIERPPREIEVIRQILKVVKQIQIVEVEVPIIKIQKQIEIREVEKYIQVPIIVPQVKVETEIHQVPFIETVEYQRHIPVEVIKNVVLYQQQPVQVVKNVPFIMKQQIPVYFKEETTIPMEMYYERIKQVPTTKQKIIEKIVEVPKCVEVERIVQKIVIVPRIIQRIVEVPQIIQKIVEKIIEVPVASPPVEHIIEKPCRVEVPVYVDRQRIVYITVDRPVEVPGDTKMVIDMQTRTNIQVERVIEQRVRVHKEQVPVTMHVDKIVTIPVEKHIIHNVDKILVTPVEVPVPITLQKTVPVYINTETVHVEPVPHVVQKIVEKVVIQRQPQIISQIQERVVVQDKYQFQQIPKVYIEKEIQQVDRFEEKFVEMRTTIDQLRQVPYLVQKLVPVIQEIPKIFQFEKEPKIVYTPPTIEIVERIVPKIINVNKYIEKIVEKLIEVPHLLREVQIIKERHEKNIPGPERTNTVLKTVNLQMEKELIKQKEKVIETKVGFIEQTLKTVVKVMERQMDPVIITQDRIIEVPYVLQKIVEKIVVMPQIVEVLKYVNQIIDNDELNINVDISTEAAEYKRIGEDLQKGFSDFLTELNKIKSLQPSSAQRISMIEQYLSKFRRFIKYPKIHEIIRETVVQKQKQKLVKIPVSKGPAQVRQDLAKVLLIQKLIAQITRLKRTYPQIELDLDEDINFIFRLNFDGKVKDVNSKLNSQLKQFENSLDRKFTKMGGWSTDHQMMLRSFLEERFVLANIVKNSNEETRHVKKQNEQLVMQIGKSKALVSSLYQTLTESKNIMPSILKSLNKEKDSATYKTYSLLTKKFDDVINNLSNLQNQNFQPTRYLGKKFIEDMVGSSLRQKQKQIEILKSKLRNSKFRDNDHAQCTITIQNLQFQISRMTKQIEELNRNGRDPANKLTIRNLEMEIQRLNKQVRDSSTIAMNKSQSEINRLTLLVQQNSSHTRCQSVQKGLEVQIQRLKQYIDELLAKLKNAEKEVSILRVTASQKDFQSPRNSTTFGTKNTVYPREQSKQSIVISHAQRNKSQSEETYGHNFFQYTNGDTRDAGTVEGTQQSAYQSGYHSGIHEPRDLAGSSTTFRSGQVITSSQYVRTPTTAVNAQSARYIQENEGTQHAGTTVKASGAKKYTYYQRKYQTNS